MPDGIRVNAVCTGPIDTPALVTSMAKFDAQLGQPEGTIMTEIVQNHVRRRIGRPEDVANVALFLASDESEWESAQFINISGNGH